MSFRPTEASEGIIEANIFQECLTMNKIGYLLFLAGAMSPLQPPTMGDEFSLKIRLNDFPLENHKRTVPDPAKPVVVPRLMDQFLSKNSF